VIDSFDLEKQTKQILDLHLMHENLVGVCVMEHNVQAESD
jgi:hypothetical protein